MDADNYYQSLISQGLTPAHALMFTQQNFPGYAGPANAQQPMEVQPTWAADSHPTIAQQPVVQQQPVAYQQPVRQQQPMMQQQQPMMGGAYKGGMPMNRQTGVMAWVSVGILVAMVTMTIIAINLESWRTVEHSSGSFSNDDYEEYDADFGLLSLTWESQRASFDGDDYDQQSHSGDTHDYHEVSDDCDDGNTECTALEEMETAGVTGLIFSWLGVAVGVAAIGLIITSALGKMSRNPGMITAYSAGGLITLGWILWLILFPDLKNVIYDEAMNYGYGFGFILAVISGILGLVAGVLMTVDKGVPH